MQFKKLAAIAGSALMAGLALTGPVLATTVTQLGKVSDMVSVTDSTVSFPMFVIGASAATADVAGAVDVAVNLASNAVVTSAVTSTIPGESVTGGVKIATSGVYLTPYTSPQNVKGIITSSDIPSLLNGGTYSSASGGSYNYKQYLYVLGESTNSNPAQIKYERPTTESAPRISFKTPASSTLYTYKMTFSTPVSLSGVTDDTTLKAIIQGTTLNILGRDFIVSDATYSSAITSVTLLGGKNVVSIETGTPQTITMDSKDYTITLSGVAVQTVGSTTVYTALGDVNGQQFQLKSGQVMTLADGTLISAISVFQGKTGAADFAKIAIGADKITLSSAGTVTKGTTVVSELTSGITGTAAAGWSSMTISYAPSQDSWLSAGSQITEPFASTFNIKFNSVIPDFTDTTNRQSFTFNPSGYNMLFSYKNAADVEKQMYTLYTTDGSTWRYASAAAGSPTNFDNDFRDIVFDEGKNISAVEQDYFVIQKGGFSHVMQFTSYTNSTKTYTFTDESGNSITAIGSTGIQNDTADLIVDGNTYKVLLADDTKKIINIDLNGNTYIAGQVSTGSYGGLVATGGIGTTYINREYSYLMPKLITTGQGGIYFSYGNATANVTAAGFKYALTGFAPIRLSQVAGVITVGEWSDADKAWVNQSATMTVATTAYGNYTVANIPGKYIDYQVRCTNTTLAYDCVLGIGKSGSAMQSQPGLVLVEEAQQGGSTHNWIFVPVAWDSTNSRTYVNTALQTDDSNYADLPVIGTATQYKGMTTYGTLTDHLASTLGGSATINYPDVFMYGNVYLMTPTGTISSGGTGGTTTTQQVLPITADVIKLDTDSDINSVIQNNDVIIVGGPCINKIAAQVLDKTAPACGAESGIPENAALIKLFADKFATGKTALLIAGWEADNTDLAARIVQTGFPGATSTQKAGTEVTVTGTVASPSYS